MSASDTAQRKAENVKNMTANKAQEAKGFGAQKAGEVQQTTQGVAEAVKDKAHGGKDKASEAGEGVWEQAKTKASEASVFSQEKASGAGAYVRDMAVAAKDQAAGALGQAQQTRATPTGKDKASEAGEGVWKQAKTKASEASLVTQEKASVAGAYGQDMAVATKDQAAGALGQAQQTMATPTSKDKASEAGEGVWEQAKSKASEASVVAQEKAFGAGAYVRDTAVAAKDQAAGALGQAQQTIKDTFSGGSKSH